MSVGYIMIEALILTLNAIMWPTVRDYLIHVKFEIDIDDQVNFDTW